MQATGILNYWRKGGGSIWIHNLPARADFQDDQLLDIGHGDRPLTVRFEIETTPDGRFVALNIRRE
jgi:hypothetical protein